MRKLAGSLLGLAIALAAGCDGDDVYVMSEYYELVGNERVFEGGGCAMAIQDGRFGAESTSGSAFSHHDGDFGVSEESTSERFTVEVSSAGKVLERREYSKSELLSGDEDRFEVETKAGRRYELAYWGGRKCDESHVPDDE